MGTGPWIIDLCRAKSWRELTPRERELFSEWLADATPSDLFMLVTHSLSFEPNSDMEMAQATCCSLVPDCDCDK